MTRRAFLNKKFLAVGLNSGTRVETNTSPRMSKDSHEKGGENGQESL
jgi:hypothetical protein